jgi:apolipoprotein N-acyltransferase
VVHAVAPFGLGALSVLAFTPWEFYALAPITVACLCALWWHAQSPWRTGLQGFMFGLGLFVVGTSWIHVGFARFLPQTPSNLRWLLVAALHVGSALFTAGAGAGAATSAR